MIRSSFLSVGFLLGVSICLPGFVTCQTAVPHASGLEAYYAFNGNTNDASGNGYHGTPIHVPSFTKDRFGWPSSAYFFDGAGSYISLPGGIPLHGNLTVSFWIKTAVSDTGSWPDGTYIIDRDIDGLHRDWNIGLGMSGRIEFTTGTGSQDIMLPTRAQIKHDTWQHVVVVRDTADRKKRIYFDGQLMVTGEYDSLPFDNSGQLVFLGASVVDPAAHHYYSGSLDDIRFFARALNVGEIDSLYHLEGWPPSPTPPWVYTNTGTSHTIIIPINSHPSFAGAPLDSADYIGVFYDSSGVRACAGYVLWTGTVNVALSAFGDDPTTIGIKEGFAAGELFQWAIYRPIAGRTCWAYATYAGIGALGGIVSDTSAFHANGISALASLDVLVVGVQEELSPAETVLFQNYPNPFNPITVVSFQLSVASKTKLAVFDLLGREVAVLREGIMPAGHHEVTFDATGFPSGVYLCRMQAGSYVRTKKLILLR